VRARRRSASIALGAPIRGARQQYSRAMRIEIVTPAARGMRNGNRVTALRWAKRLRELGHAVDVAEQLSEREIDLLVALHAVKSAPSIERCGRRAPGVPRVVALAGTDLQASGASADVAAESLESAARIVALQPLAVRAVPVGLRSKVRVVRQSAPT
jgi:hypothetical protein